ncbi:SKI complex RNA helicase subunit SKI2 [Ascoidea rubescens DSM 1968]|uniref:Antiviral helicase n=1 Tax=Ascoidea rubescens DSM 1968 TaxID=1344418 RepID=A0A1D2VNN2_9ASCO|nr:antiviral helicase [Ascoidea rubescens DSM 1968]ODV63218.1 antiviral helicase [Ascoidea rubescens DSM 1968]
MGNELDNQEDFLKEFLIPSAQLPWQLLDLTQTDLKDSNKNSQLFNSLLTLPKSISKTTLTFKRKGFECTISDSAEVLDLSTLNNNDATTSASLSRNYTSKNDSVLGQSSFLPFKPGGINTESIKNNTSSMHRDEFNLFDIPQGLSRGLFIKNTSTSKDYLNFQKFEDSNDTFEDSDNKLDQINQINQIDENINQPDSQSNNDSKNNVSKNSIFKNDTLNEIDELLPFKVSFNSNNNDSNKPKSKHRKYAHVIDINHKIDNFEELVPDMARTWPFTLDVFQKEAIYHLEQNDSVFVAAHTSAGKTVVAEYAIAMAHRNMTKTIYTSPIKALSNQKFRDFKETFPDIEIGLITGDVQINPHADCLIMTTEVLRSMLYRGADLIRDVEFVIFDEVHYVNDIDRGVVWEEVIIMLPDHVKFILLSATVPNTLEFAEWIGRTKQKDIYVISTTKRPIPLEISIWAKNKLFTIIDAERNFLDLNFKKHKEEFEKPSRQFLTNNRGRKNTNANQRGSLAGNRGSLDRNRGSSGGNRGRMVKQTQSFKSSYDGPNKSTWPKLVQYLKSNGLLPGVIFVFSKKRCEEYADFLTGVDFCTAKEKSQIRIFIDRAVSRLKKDDKDLPQILKVREMLSRGIGVHHGGLLPIVKEIIEILFSKTLVKVLFATETFAMGLNLPTRTVVFDKLRKHDGKNFRNLLPGEFTQMSGRAGRRGLDPIGTVIVMAYNNPLESLSFKEVTLGLATKLTSQFRLTYIMILNLLRIEALKVEEMIKHSFSENLNRSLLPEHEKLTENLQNKLKDLEFELSKENFEFSSFTEKDIEELCLLFKRYNQIQVEIISEAFKGNLTKHFKTGKLLVFIDNNGYTRPGLILKIDLHLQKFIILSPTINIKEAEKLKDVPFSNIPYITSISGFTKLLFPTWHFEKGLEQTEISFGQINIIFDDSLDISFQKLLNNDSSETEKFRSQFNKLLRFSHSWKDLVWNKTTLELNDLMKQQFDVSKQIANNQNFSNAIQSEYFLRKYKIINKKIETNEEIQRLQYLVSDQNLKLLPDYQQRLLVLKKLEFVDKNLNVLLKGRIACEISSGWELFITELIVDNFLGEFEPEEIVALLTCFVYEGRTKDEEEPLITARLEKGKQKIKKISEVILATYQQFQVPLTRDEEEFMDSKRFALCNVVYEWARGMSFKKIMEISPEAEGTIVRVITRLDEVCREVKNAALIVGDSRLHSSMTDAQDKIKRDIVFCASLYL